ncbi:MAG: RES family NAD+ phosphorylase [Niabella sp.]
MKVYRISHCKYINDLSGTGSALYGGRWHSKGTYILYTASSSSLALLESIVHISSILPLRYCMICLNLPDVPLYEIDISKLPKGWNNNPSPDFIKSIGDNFIMENQFLALKIPSAIASEEMNYLINPAHKDFKKVKLIFSRIINIDNRLLK